MNNPDDIVIDIDEQRAWLQAEKDLRRYSWTQLAGLTGIPTGTLSPFMTGQYAGRNDNVAKKIFQYRQLVESQAQQASYMPEAPRYFETPTGELIRGCLIYAHSGEVAVTGTGPGMGKTLTAEDYQSKVGSTCWMATMSPTTRTLNAMLSEVLRAVGGQARHVWARQASQQIMGHVAGKRGLIIIDEANNLELEALEEIRTWHDRTGVGIALLGNEELINRIEGGPRRDAFARLNSRIGQRLVQNLPVEGDIDAFCDAWKIEDAASRKLLARVAMTPGSGALRECRQIVKGAAMLASLDGRSVTFADVRDAHSTRATRNIRTI